MIPLTINGPKTQPHVLEKLKKPRAIPLFAAFSPIYASLGAAKAPFAVRSIVFERIIFNVLGKYRIILEHKAKAEGTTKSNFLF